MPTLVISVVCDHLSDLECLRNRAHGAVVTVVEDIQEDGALDGEVEVSWEIEDDE
jgi:hypothetical protein